MANSLGWTSDVTGSNLPINVAYGTAQVNVVPIPGALWLLGSGLVGLVVMKRRKKA
jgi:hypothetical protein